jgi:hypothetical protein
MNIAVEMPQADSIQKPTTLAVDWYEALAVASRFFRQDST